MVSSYAYSIELDGLVYECVQSASGRGIQTQNQPIIAGQTPSLQLDPKNYVTFHKGSLIGRSLGGTGGIHWGKNVWTLDPGMLLPGPYVTTVTLPTQPTADIVAWAEQDGHIYAAGGATVYRLPGGDGPAVVDQNLGAGSFANSLRKFGNSLFLGRSDTLGGSLWEKPTASAWTQVLTGAANVYRGRMTTVVWTLGSPAITQERLVAEVVNATTPSIQYTTGDPRNSANWGPVIPVGSFPITRLIASRDHVYVATTGGLRDLDVSGLAPNLTPEAESLLMTTNGAAAMAAGGWAYINVGYGLLRVRIVGTQYAAVQQCGPGAGQVLPNESPVAGYFTDVVRYRSYIIASLYDAITTTSYICWAREANQDESGPLTWFVAPITLDNAKVTSLWISGLISGNPRLWIGSVTSTIRTLYWVPLPVDTPYGDLRAGRAYRFSQSYQVDLSNDDDGDDSMLKYLPEAVLEGEALSGASNVAVSLAADGDGSYQTIGTARTSPRSTLRPPTPINYYRRTVRLNGTGTVTVPPVLRRLTLRPMPRPDTRQVRVYQIKLGRANRSIGGNLDGVDPEDRKRTLDRLQTARSPVSFRDEAGRTAQAIVMGGISYSELETSAQERVEVATVTLAVLSPRGATFKWNAAIKYDASGRVWAE